MGFNKRWKLNSPNTYCHSPSSAPFIPGEIIFDMLVRVPARDLISFRRVCKLWKDIIDSHNFSKAHLNYWKSKFEIILVQGVFPSQDFVSLDIRNNNYHQLPLRNMADNSNVTVLDSLDGLILFSIPSLRRNQLYVCNPLTQKLKSLGQVPRLWKTHRTFYKLVFDFALQKYKVIGFCLQFPQNSKCCILTLNGYDQEVVESPVWRKIKIRSRHSVRLEFAPLVVNGVLCWLAHTISKDIEDRVIYIQTMDIVAEEVKQKILLPCQPKDYHSVNSMLLQMENMEESLCIAIPESQTELGIWKLEEWDKHIWIKKYNLHIDPELGRPLHFSKRFSILFVMDADNSEKVKFIVRIHGELYSCSLNTQNQKETCEGSPRFTYVPSLIFLD